MKKIYIPRDLEQRIKRLSKSFSAIALTGPRQSGKTTLLQHAFPDYTFCSLDDTLVRSKAISDPETFLNMFPDPVIIDEIQYAPDILSHIKMRIDDNPGQKGKYILTGSQQFLMIKGMSETLAGRIALINAYPLSASELSGFKKFKTGYKLFEYACLTGTYPEPAVRDDMPMKDWYAAYLSSYIERDAKTLYNIGSLTSFDNFVRILAARPCQMLNLSSLAADTQVSVNTIKSWISILQASGIIYLLYPYFSNTRTQLVKTPKVYFTDTGLISRLNRVDTAGDVMSGNISGLLFENFVVIEVLKALNNAGSYDKIYYFRTSKGIEVDLLIERGKSLVPVEIKATRTPPNSSAEQAAAANKILKGRLLPGYIACLREGIFPVSKEISSAGIFELLAAVSSRG